MANYRAIATVGQTLAALIEGAYQPGLFQNLEADFKLIQAKDLQPGPPLDRGVTVYLYRLALNANRRNLSPRITPDGRRLPPPIPVDLQFLITAWWKGGNGAANQPAQEQQWLLALAIRALEDNPLLPSGLLNQVAGATVFREGESLEVVGEVLPMNELVAIWEVNKNQMQPSATYTVRAVMIDSEQEFFEGAPVQVRDFALARPGGVR